MNDLDSFKLVWCSENVVCSVEEDELVFAPGLLSGPRVDHGGEERMKPGIKKYSCELTLDPNTVSRSLSLCEENRMVVWAREEQPYPDHPERFDYWYQQVLCRESLTGRGYWEAEWSGEVYIAVKGSSISSTQLCVYEE
ncbi:hypothetical protein NFI96_007492 [Prochilodus magdalenae]|nr:hypothetical protein NFI96_007492 [Prochilodus magdalenae]